VENAGPSHDGETGIACGRSPRAFDRTWPDLNIPWIVVLPGVRVD